MTELIPDINKGLTFHEPKTADLHLQLQQLQAHVVRLAARVTVLEDAFIAEYKEGN